ncbi:MAG TPA: dihydroxyacetone kinase subunit DhaK [Candidatus Obscuribacterales bacterium]
MKKFINNPANLVGELLEGFALAFPEKIKLRGKNLIIRATPKQPGKVGVVTLGGSGHEPGLSGFVGEGLLDISVAGGIFAAPGGPAVADAIKLADGGCGVLLIILNHAGDIVSGNMAVDLARRKGTTIESVLTHEDISTGPKHRHENGRGLVGFLPVFKIAGAAAEQGMNLAAVRAIAERMSANMRTLAVAIRAATHPATGAVIGDPTNPLGDSEMEIGMGQHGEAGVGRSALKSADETAAIMLDALLDHLDVKAGEELLVIVNGSGATTLMELFIVFRRISQLLLEKNIHITRSLVGEYITTQEQAGFQLCIARMDGQLLRLWDAPCDSPYWVVR